MANYGDEEELSLLRRPNNGDRSWQLNFEGFQLAAERKDKKPPRGLHDCYGVLGIFFSSLFRSKLTEIERINFTVFPFCIFLFCVPISQFYFYLFVYLSFLLVRCFCDSSSITRFGTLLFVSYVLIRLLYVSDYFILLISLSIGVIYLYMYKYSVFKLWAF